MSEEIVSEFYRWQTRQHTFEWALAQLDDVVAIANARDLNDFELMGLIKAFETAYELAWRVLKAFFLYQGNPTIDGSHAAFRAAIEVGLLEADDAWMRVAISREQALHAYDEDIANALGKIIPQHHLVWFKHFAEVMRREMSRHAQYSL